MPKHCRGIFFSVIHTIHISSSTNQLVAPLQTSSSLAYTHWGLFSNRIFQSTGLEHPKAYCFLSNSGRSREKAQPAKTYEWRCLSLEPSPSYTVPILVPPFEEFLWLPRPFSSNSHHLGSIHPTPTFQILEKCLPRTIKQRFEVLYPISFFVML